MTISNQEATQAYRHALHNMPGTRPGHIASLADKMAAAAFDGEWNSPGFKLPTQDDMLNIETAIFVALCKTNRVDWRLIEAGA